MNWVICVGVLLQLLNIGWTGIVGNKREILKDSNQMKPMFFHLIDDGPDVSHTISKRLIPLGSNTTQQPNKSYQYCATPTGRRGQCKHSQYCQLPEFKQNFWRFIDYLCIIEKTSIGVCCPQEFSERSEFSASLPAQVDADEDTGVDGRIVNRPEQRGCGIATKSFPKISGGRPADPKEWPWMAAILLRHISHIHCGGTLITDRHILTAAHCFTSHLEDYSVRLGEYNFIVDNETRARDFRIVDLRIHVDYDKTRYDNDIAILLMDRATLFNSYIWPVCLPPSGDSWEGFMAVVTGWGTQGYGAPHSDILMEVSVPVWSTDRCKSSFGAHAVSNKMICAGEFIGGRDACQGDSGGPLMIQLGNRRWVAIGVVSWGIECGTKNYPGIYTRISSHIEWIIENSY